MLCVLKDWTFFSFLTVSFGLEALRGGCSRGQDMELSYLAGLPPFPWFLLETATKVL